MRYAFQNFELDCDRCTLTRSGTPLELRPKCFDLLVYLLRNPRRVASKDELISALWQDVSVTENSLTQCVTQLRQALGEAGKGLVRTVPRRGYMLEAEVATHAPFALPPAAIGAVLASIITAVLASVIWIGSWSGPVSPPPAGLLGRLTETAIGQSFSYPEGRPLVMSGIRTLVPGQSSDWHSHDVPLVAVVLSGELTLDYGSAGKRTLVAGDTVVEAIGTLHKATNTSDSEARIVVVELSTTE